MIAAGKTKGVSVLYYFSRIRISAPEKATYQTGNSNKNRRIYGRRNCCYRRKGNEQNRIKYIMKIPEDIQKIKRKNM